MNEIDEKISSYLVRATAINKYVVEPQLDSCIGAVLVRPCRLYGDDVVEIAKMIQLEEHYAKVKRKRERKEGVLYFDYDKKEWFNISKELELELKELYPQKDVYVEFRAMTGWLIKNMGRKRKQDFVKFVHGWFGRDK